MLGKILESLLEEDRPMTVTLRSRASISRRQTKAQQGEPGLPEPKERHISFPGASAQEAWNFTVLLRIMEIIHSGLIGNTVMTKRDIYYHHPDLFVKQAVVDRYVDDLACTFGISRLQLNVTAAAKGLVAGNFTLVRASGNEVHAINEAEGMLIPTIGEEDMLSLNLVRWILVIEKEATFRALLSSPHWEAMKSYGVVLTAKGYPDIASRRFLRHLADHNPRIPIYAFVDLDPDGIAIMYTYKYGSYRLAHEDVTPNNTYGLSLPKIRWLGVKVHHISRTPVDEGDTDTDAVPRLQGLMKLTARDRAKAIRMLEWDLCAHDGPEQEWRQELQSMLMLNLKAEMQILDELASGLVSWLRRALDESCEQPGGLVCAEDQESDAHGRTTEDRMLF
ncbi:DNA topoisomerase IV, alpha subunit [Plenodomus tracheiphilus IPT5]|uniref:DNA topoisomerase (ATP-hydrolyzing) n=1 Tax=Plenodomus tracheiphilus IPT5 TaxID=1408161 RepID=A0A6A7BBB1_9PLEO|nr:DNA topoisomerase IV, alpha subunit [Plenodomus tracheiphilus IPT5]